MSDYDQMRALARRLLAGERRHHTLTPTALVHESFLRAAGRPADAASVSDRARATLSMRRVLIDHARRRGRLKRLSVRGAPDTVEPDGLGAEGNAAEIASLREALQQLAEISPERALACERVHLEGRNTQEIADEFGISRRNVQIWLRSSESFLRARALAPRT